MACAWRSLSQSCAYTVRRGCLFLQKRHRYKKKWAVNLPTKTPSQLAQEHFDAFYKLQFGHQWPSVRISLLSLPKYAAIINNASDSRNSVQQLLELGAIDLIQEAVNIVKTTGLSPGEYASSDTELESTEAETIDHDIGQSRSGLSEVSLKEEKNRNEEIQSLKGSSSTSAINPATQAENAEESLQEFSVPSAQWNAQEESYSHRDVPHIDDMKNLLTPDIVKSSTDLEYFMPTEQVFSEREELRLQEYAQNMYQERAVSVSVLPGQSPLLPKSLRVMVFPSGDLSDFPKPSAKSHLLNYYLLDAASILPVLALDVQPGHNVLDQCAAPGGKSLALLQILLSQGGHLDSNDVSKSRMSRLRTVLKSYLPADLQEDFVYVTERNGIHFREPLYNKVLVDVPCNSDRHVLVEDENNLFKPGRLKERLNLTTLQKDLLLAGIKSCKPGGSVVYSTCTLAAAQNDGVVQAAVEELWETSDIDVAVEDLSPLKTMFAPFFRFHTGTRLGLLVVPSLLNNYGPAYCCKLKRLA